MNNKKKNGRTRLKMPEEMIEAALSIIMRQPRVKMEGLLNRALRRDARWVKHIFKHEVVAILTERDMARIEACDTQAEAWALFNKLLKPRPGEYCIDRRMATRIKNALRRRGHQVYGALKLGYIHEDDLDAETAALWLRPRLRKLQKESDLWHSATMKLRDEATTPEQRAVVRKLRGFVTSIDATFLREVADEVERLFIRE